MDNDEDIIGAGYSKLITMALILGAAIFILVIVGLKLWRIFS